MKVRDRLDGSCAGCHLPVLCFFGQMSQSGRSIAVTSLIFEPFGQAGFSFLAWVLRLRALFGTNCDQRR